MSVYALNLFDLADNDDYRAYSRPSRAALKHWRRPRSSGDLATGKATGDAAVSAS